MAKAIVFEIPISTVNAEVMTVDSTVPREEKKMTVVATRIMIVELSLIASRSGTPFTFFGSCEGGISISLPRCRKVTASKKNKIFAIWMAASNFHPEPTLPNSSVPTKPMMNIGPGAWQAARSRPLCFCDNSPFFIISVTVTAPTGNPPNDPSTYAFKKRLLFGAFFARFGIFKSHCVKMI